MTGVLGLIIALCLLTLSVTVFLVVARGFARLWLDYQIKRAFLEQAACNPSLVQSTEEIPEYLGQLSADTKRNPQHFGLTGALLVLIGAAAMATGYGLYAGQLAVGLYFGGAGCIIVGAVTALFSMLLRYLRGAQPVARSK